MSIEQDVMQFVLDIMINGIVNTTKQQIGYTPHTKITEDDLNFIQVFTISTENEDEDEPTPGLLTFQLELFQTAGKVNEIRTRLQALDETLRIDPSFNGLIQRGVITERAAAELPDDKRSIGVATIAVQFKEPDPILTSDDTSQESMIRLVNFSNSATVSNINSLIEDSQRMKNALGVRRNVASSGALQLAVTSGLQPARFPIDLTNLHRLRFLYYVNPEYADAMTSVALTCYSDAARTNGDQFNPAEDTFIGTHGWRHVAYNIDLAPDFVFGSGWDRANTNAFDWTWTMFFAAAFVSNDFGMIVANFGYHTRDSGGDVGSGFHPGY